LPNGGHSSHRLIQSPILQLSDDSSRPPLGDDDYNPPMSPMDALIAREIAASLEGDEGRLLDADEDLKQTLIEARVADVTRSVLGKLGWDDATILNSLEERVDEIADEKSASAAQAMDGQITELRSDLTENRAEIFDEMARIKQLRQDAAGLAENADSKRTLALVVSLCLLTLGMSLAG